MLGNTERYLDFLSLANITRKVDEIENRRNGETLYLTERF